MSLVLAMRQEQLGRPKQSLKLSGNRQGAGGSRCQKLGRSLTSNRGWKWIKKSRLGGMQARMRDRWEEERPSPRDFFTSCRIMCLESFQSCLKPLHVFNAYKFALLAWNFRTPLLVRCCEVTVTAVIWKINCSTPRRFKQSCLFSEGHVKLELLREETIQFLLEALRMAILASIEDQTSRVTVIVSLGWGLSVDSLW